MVGGAAFATIPNSTTGVITGCYSKQAGALRLIDKEAGASCKSNELEISWNQRGPSGAGAPSVIAGVVTFVDPADTSGFIGMGGEANLAASADSAASPLPATGTVSGFRASIPSAAAGNVVLTLYVNGGATGLTCTIAATQTTCANGSNTAAVSTGDTVAVAVTNGSGLLRHLRWSARLAT